MPAYASDPSLEPIGQKIIDEYRPDLKILKIKYLFRDKAPVSENHVTAGMCYRVDDRNRTLHGYDIIIELARDVWDEANDDFRRALVDHELGHIGIRIDDDSGSPAIDDATGRVKVYLRKHDIEEFEDVLERHGAYHKGLRSFLEAFAKGRDKKGKKADETEE